MALPAPQSWLQSPVSLTPWCCRTWKRSSSYFRWRISLQRSRCPAGSHLAGPGLEPSPKCQAGGPACRHPSSQGATKRFLVGEFRGSCLASAANRALGRASAHLRALLPSQSRPLPSEMLRMEAANCPKTTAFSPGLWAACWALFILLHSGFTLRASGSCHWWHRAHQTHYNYANLNYANRKPQTQREELPSPTQASCP